MLEKNYLNVIFLLFIFCVPLYCFSQVFERDSFPLLMFKAYPVLNYSSVKQTIAIGGLAEYHFRKYFSLEGGGEKNIGGYTIRSGVRFYGLNGRF